MKDERQRSAAHFAEEPGLPERARRAAVSTATILGILVVVLASATGLAALLLPDDDTTDQAAADDGGGDLPDNEWKPSGTTTSTSSSTTTSTSSTSSTTSTTAPPDVVDPVTSTTAPRPTTSRPTTTTSPATTSTTAPDPVIDWFDADVLGRGCGQNATPVNISWSTSNATSVTLGRVPGGQSGVPADGQISEVCVSDSGETWRLTASGSGEPASQEIFINP